MNNEITENFSFPFTVKLSKKAQHLSLSVFANGEIVVVKPFKYNDSLVKKFVKEKENWVKKKIAQINQNLETFIPISNGSYKRDKIQAFNLVNERISFYNNHYNFNINRISIKNQKRLWGSCSINNNININFRIIYLPLILCDYIIVHELCHLKEMNHSYRFWELVEKTLPNYKELKKDLRKYRFL